VRVSIGSNKERARSKLPALSSRSPRTSAGSSSSLLVPRRYEIGELHAQLRGNDFRSPNRHPGPAGLHQADEPFRELTSGELSLGHLPSDAQRAHTRSRPGIDGSVGALVDDAAALSCGHYCHEPKGSLSQARARAYRLPSGGLALACGQVNDDYGSVARTDLVCSKRTQEGQLRLSRSRGAAEAADHLARWCAGFSG